MWSEGGLLKTYPRGKWREDFNVFVVNRQQASVTFHLSSDMTRWNFLKNMQSRLLKTLKGRLWRAIYVADENENAWTLLLWIILSLKAENSSISRKHSLEFSTELNIKRNKCDVAEISFHLPANWIVGEIIMNMLEL